MSRLNCTIILHPSFLHKAPGPWGRASDSWTAL